MADRREWNILPAVIEGEDGTERCPAQLPEIEKAEFRRQICRKISQCLSGYYAAHGEEWEVFAKELPQEDR